MKVAYPYLEEWRAQIYSVIAAEERQFARTLDAGVVQFEEALIPLTSAERVVGRSRRTSLSPDAPVLPGDVAFRLHDTYGFPIDLTVELAAEYGVRVDRAGFEAGSRRAARAVTRRTEGRAGRSCGDAAALCAGRPASRGPRRTDTKFLGYETTSADGKVVAILRDGVEYENLEAKPEAELRAPADAEAEIVLDQTPFYAEGGGQVGDQGVLRASGRHGRVHGRATRSGPCPG